ncbi:hypothetical protein [Haloferula sp. BvORR071]|uniref:hypothetical protein n=1 Tax=Haloferula sp. BvORR071 TaxID=1396141 RepID=UPI0005532997|nr:hypothetical protein [Haloferula sp. BvORR071]
MKKSIIIPLLGLLGTAAAHAQAAPKPGSISPLLFEATITTENAPQDQNLPQGSKRRTFTVNSVRLVNRDILEAMRTAPLLDGTITGWSIARVADANGVGNLYAIKAGKTAVAVPANLLSQPVAQGTATTGSSIIPATGPARPNLIRKTYATMAVKQGSSTAAGTQTIKFGTLKIGTTNHVIQTQIDNFNITGDSFTGQGIIAGTYRTQRPALGNLIALFPGATVP